MITFYSGTPGSGKSFHIAKSIIFALRTMRNNVISTVNVNTDMISKFGRRKIGDFVYKSILELTPKFLYEYAIKNHKKGKEGQTLLVIDECQILFNPREYQIKGRQDWVLFFTKHRHLGYNIILSSQFDRLIDRQIRSLFEYEIKHRKANNLGLLFMLPFTFFVCIEYWYGVRLVISRSFMLYRKSVASIYDSYVMYDDFEQEFNYVLSDNKDKKSKEDRKYNKDNNNKSLAAAATLFVEPELVVSDALLQTEFVSADAQSQQEPLQTELVAADAQSHQEILFEQQQVLKGKQVLKGMYKKYEDHEYYFIDLIRNERNKLDSPDYDWINTLSSEEQSNLRDEIVYSEYIKHGGDSSLYDEFFKLSSDSQVGVGGSPPERKRRGVDKEHQKSDNFISRMFDKLTKFFKPAMELADIKD